MPNDPPDSYIYVALDGSTTYVGELGMKLKQAQELRACLAAPLGAMSTRKLLLVAQAFTGRRYARTESSERLRAVHDLDDWIAGFELIVPVLEEEAPDA